MSEIKLSLMTQHSSLSSLSEYEFNKKSPKMIHHSIILNSTHLAKTLFMESPGFINFLGRKSIVTQMINLDYASLVFVMCGARVLDYWLQNSKELLPSPVRKCSDAEQGNREHTINNNNPNSNVPYGNVPNWLANEMDITENSTHGNRDGGGGGGSGGGGGGSDGGSGVPAQFIEIHRITVDSSNGGSVSRSPIIYTNIFASEYHSWAGISRAIHYIWLGHEGYNDNDDNNNNNDDNNNSSSNNNNSNNNSNVRQDYSPLNCWPGSLVYFGRYEGNAFRQYHWFLNAWEDVKEKLSVVIVLKRR